MSVVEIENLTKDYGDGKGIFNVSLTIEKGEMVGFVGTNGSGKTTTIRSMLGFVKPTSGECRINGLNSWNNSSEVVKNVGYVPGEIAFPDLPTGISFLKSQAGFLGLKNLDYANYLIEKLQLDTKANLKRMSKGMKQKTALVAALMANHDIIVLDEPTTGLDPLMRIEFMEIVKAEHKKGKTIFMSSHMYEEIEDSCDKVVLINDGKIVDVVDMSEINNRLSKDYKIEFNTENDYKKFKKLKFNIIRDQSQYNQVTINIGKSDVNKMFSTLNDFDVKFISEVKYTLEKHFQNIIKKQKENKNV